LFVGLFVGLLVGLFVCFERSVANKRAAQPNSVFARYKCAGQEMKRWHGQKREKQKKKKPYFKAWDKESRVVGRL
jgi:hypothetical protein